MNDQEAGAQNDTQRANNEVGNAQERIPTAQPSSRAYNEALAAIKANHREAVVNDH